MKQLDYVTAVSAQVSAIRSDGTAYRHHIVPGQRYLAVRSGGAPHDVFDEATRVSQYPSGITTQAERQRVVALLQNPPVGLATGFNFYIAHEVGHQLQWRTLGQYPHLNYTHHSEYPACLELCTDADPFEELFGCHSSVTKEATNTAVLEGMADFYANAVFNSDGVEADCTFALHYSADWLVGDSTQGPDGTDDGVPTYSCDKGWALPSGWYRWMESECAVASDEDNTVQVDWSRFYWDLYTEGPVSVGEILDIWRDADPQSWGTTPRDYEELRQSAIANGYLSLWDPLADEHGVDHDAY